MKRWLLIICLGTFFLPPLWGCSERPKEKAKEEASGLAAGDKKDRAPQVVPYFDSVPSAVDGEGRAAANPPGPFPAGSRQDFEITFTAGPSGIAPGGFVILQVSPWWGWSPPQTLYPRGEGYVEVTASFSDPPIEVETLSLNRVLVFSPQGLIPAGGSITFNYGPARVDRFAEEEELFQIFVDADGDGHSAPISNPPAVQTAPGSPVKLEVSAPPQAVPGEKIEVRAAPLDRSGNWSDFPAGSYVLAVTCGGEKLSEKNLRVSGGEKTITFSITLPAEGIYFFQMKGPLGLGGKSNVTLCREGEPRLKLYFGDIHGHSSLSDGTGTPEDFYRFAREVMGLDIAALTDHADFGTIRIEGEVWERIKRAANRDYTPGRFVTFLAFEWTNWKFGHRNVYYRDGDGPIFRSFDPESDTPGELWELIAPYEAMTVAHHVGGGPVATDWSIAPGPKEWLVEISSIHGSSEYYGAESCVYRPVEGSFVRDALGRGYKLGIIGSGDTHDGHPGRRSDGAPLTGLVGVYSSELTREAVWEAFRGRRVYATSGPKIILNFRLADSPMGSEVDWPVSRGPVPVALRAVGCDEIRAVEIIRNGETVFSQEGEGVFTQLLVEDPSPPPGTSWYYAKVIQKDGNMAWSSPIWLTMIGP